MEIIANIVGLLAVGMFVMSYQFKTRKILIIFNAGSRLLYVLQYILLGAFSGAALDGVAFVISLIFERRDRGFFARHKALTLVLCYLPVLVAGALTYAGPLSLLPILAVISETIALWLIRERHIRIVSLVGQPLWFTYNIFNLAYGSALGNIIGIVSIGTALVRYDILGKEKPKEKAAAEAPESLGTRG